MYREEIEDFFEKNQSRMLDDICRLIRIDSAAGTPADGMPFGRGPAAALEEVLALAKSMGFQTKNYDHYVGAVDLNDLPKKLDILAHLDVVPAGDGWSVTQPFTPLLVEGKLYGRGAADDKGPAIAALYALKAVREMKIPLRGNARLVLGTDEESGFRDISHYFACEPEAPMTFSPDAKFPVVNVEKGHFSNRFAAGWQTDERLPRIVSIESGDRVNVVPNQARAVVLGFTPNEVKKYCDAVSQKTGIQFHLHTEKHQVSIEAVGTSAHASTPERGNNPITALLQLLAEMPFADTQGYQKLCAVSRLFPHGDWLGVACGIAMRDDQSGNLTISLNQFHYSSTGLSGAFDCRTPLCATAQNLVDVMAAKTASAGIPLLSRRLLPGHYVPEDSPFIQTLLACYEQYTGKKGECLSFGGGTYAHNLKNGVAFGCAMPGTENHKHGANEVALVNDLITGAKIFTQVIIDLCS